jgi:hypothetical protein
MTLSFSSFLAVAATDPGAWWPPDIEKEPSADA